MLRKIHFTHTVKVMLALVVAMVIIGFTERKSTDNTCQDIVIRIENQNGNYFVDENDILQLMTANGDEVIIGSSFDDLNLKEIEQRVEQESFIKGIQIYRDLKGNMLVEAELRRPFARVVGKNASYIAMDGTYLPISRKYNTRAVILSGKFFNQIGANLLDTEDGEAIYEMLNFIYKDEFWSAQIAQMEIDKNLNILIYPQVTKQIVEFGTPEGFEKKFKKLKIFYKEILPRKGWNTYERVNLKYKDQIVAE
ncbi:cell division protein FtsQ [Fulvivirga sp. RKSG066]|uniref:cell division protein FtsQ/DivIB n=1 Tax=Fulvivirga aurantia TaxID=2529383 RepID=UPI0012BCA0F5|nr:cell division protein FtsQ [Fulvivirga aurantia]MTI21920.1 cell division protein FtsQ [Fulvivirga aurantia]